MHAQSYERPFRATFRLLWPEPRVVSEARIRTWFADARENGELDTCLANEAVAENDAYLMARALDDAGLITIGRL